MLQIKTLVSVGLAVWLTCLGFSTSAQEWPAKSVRLIVPMPPAGTTDNMGRLVAQKMSELIGQVVVVENKAGANGNIGSDFVAKSAPDGYTLLVSGVGSQGINATLYRSMPYDIVEGLTHIGMIAKGPNALVVNPAFPANTLSELVALIKASPGKYNYASTGNGASNHLSMEMLKSAADLNVTHIPYKGGGPAAAAGLAGEVQVVFGSVVATLPQVKAGRLRALALTGLKRSSVMPDIPTLAESGFAGFNVTSWYAFLLPAKTPRPVVMRLYDEALRALKLTDVQEALARQGLEIETSASPEAFAAELKAESAAWAQVIQSAGIKAD